MFGLFKSLSSIIRKPKSWISGNTEYLVLECQTGIRSKFSSRSS